MAYTRPARRAAARGARQRGARRVHPTSRERRQGLARPHRFCRRRLNLLSSEPPSTFRRSPGPKRQPQHLKVLRKSGSRTLSTIGVTAIASTLVIAGGEGRRNSITDEIGG